MYTPTLTALGLHRLASQERIERQAESPAPPRPSLQESQAAHWARLLQLADGHRGVRMPPVAPFARQVRGRRSQLRARDGAESETEPRERGAAYRDAQVANRNVRVWHGATENGP
jgi:hypothetical protein